MKYGKVKSIKGKDLKRYILQEYQKKRVTVETQETIDLDGAVIYSGVGSPGTELEFAL